MGLTSKLEESLNKKLKKSATLKKEDSLLKNATV
jgi:hypothetical protein